MLDIYDGREMSPQPRLRARYINLWRSLLLNNQQPSSLNFPSHLLQTSPQSSVSIQTSSYRIHLYTQNLHDHPLSITMSFLKTLLTTTLVASLIHSTIAVPTLPQDQPPTAVLTKRDDYVGGLRIAADWETPPPETRDLDLTKRGRSNLSDLAKCARKAQPDWPHTQLTKVQSEACIGGTKTKGKREEDVDAPQDQKSSDNKFNLQSMCSTSQTILHYFLYNSDFETEATKICSKALDYTEVKTLDKSKLLPKSYLFGAELVNMLARKKIASTIWHTDYRLTIVTAVFNYALDSSPDAKKVAFGLCKDAVIHLSKTCFTGINDNTKQRESQKPGSVTFSDDNKKPQIKFDFSLVNP